MVTAKSAWQWLTVLSRAATGRVARSPFVELTRGREIAIELHRKRAYELDGGIRPATRRLRIHLEPAALTICTPSARRRKTLRS